MTKDTLETIKEKLSALNKNISEVNKDIKISKDKINIIEETNPDEFQEYYEIKKELSDLRSEARVIHNFLEENGYIEIVRQYFNNIADTKKKDFMHELDYILTDEECLSVEEISEILNINKKEFEDKMKQNPMQLLSLAWHNGQAEQQYVINSYFDTVSKNRVVSEKFSKELEKYKDDIKKFLSIVIPNTFNEVRSDTEISSVRSISNLLELQQIFVTTLAGALRMIMIEQAVKDSQIRIFRGTDEIHSRLIREINENNNKNDMLKNSINDIEKKLKLLSNQEKYLTEHITNLREQKKLLEQQIKSHEERINSSNRIELPAVNFEGEKEKVEPVIDNQNKESATTDKVFADEDSEDEDDEDENEGDE